MSLYEKLTAPFPSEAMTADYSRGAKNVLTSIKAHYVVERLNEVLGVDGWSTTYEFTADERGVVAVCKLEVNLEDKKIYRTAVGASPFVTKSRNGDIPKLLGDVYKSAMTDALGKAASHLGVGNEVFKGLVNPNNLGSNGRAPSKKGRSSFRPEPVAGDDI